MRTPILAAALLTCLAGAARADSAFTPTKHVAPLPGGHFLCDVGFPYDSTAVSYGGSVELDHAADAMKTDEDALVVLDAHTDASGPAKYNSGLALRRAEAVKDGLVARGIDADRIVIAVYGEHGTRGRVGKADRRVDLWMTYTVSRQQIADRTLRGGEAVIWTRPLTPQELEQRPRLVATRAPAPLAKDGTPRLTASR
jgi:hypothetical protein